jgi:hypothetical protein
VAAVQLSTATWIPTIHPYIHPSHAAARSTEPAVDREFDPSQLHVGDAHVCWACLATSLVALTPHTGPAAPAARITTAHAAASNDPILPARRFSAHRERAPPIG